MGGVPTKHHTRSKTGKRRSHHALKPQNIAACPECKHPMVSHRTCSNCDYRHTKKKA